MNSLKCCSKHAVHFRSQKLGCYVLEGQKVFHRRPSLHSKSVKDRKENVFLEEKKNGKRDRGR